MKLKNKIFLILGIFFIVLLGMITNSYCAVTYPLSNGDVTFENPPVDENPDIFIFEGIFGGAPTYFYYTYDSNVCSLLSPDSEKGRFFFADNKTHKLSNTARYYKISKDSINGSFSDIGFTSSISMGSKITNYYSSKDIYSCNDDVLNIINTGTLVFPGAPLPIPMVEPMEVGKVEELPTLIIQIVEMIIPVFLIIFGTLLVLYLIKSKNLLQL